MKRVFTSTYGRGVLVLVTALAMLIFASAASASPPTPPFTQCPPVGLDTSCEFLVEVTPSGELESFEDPSQPPFLTEDVLIGVQNNSASTVKEIKLSGSGPFGEGIFEFDGDGLCAAAPHPSGCPFGPSTYEGPNTEFAVASTTEGAVKFINGTVEAGKSSYFSLEGAIKLVCKEKECKPKPKRVPTETTVTCEPQPVVAGSSTTCTATVTDTSSEPSTPTGTVSFESSATSSFSPTSCELKAASSSSATCSVTYTPGSTPSEPVRKDTITATYAGDEKHEGSKGTTNVTVISPTALAHGSFVIGDKNAVVGSEVEWWGAEWWKLNSLSGGAAPAAFKGFAESSPSPPTCGEKWTTNPGNSSGPPTSVPAYMEVIAASKITKSGSTITGNAPEVVVVKTNPGYQPAPGHRGIGTVVAIACKS